ANYGDNTISVLLGNGDGTFQPAVTYAVGANPIAVAVADFNGHPGIVAADSNYDSKTSTFGSGSVSVLLGNGDGTFLPAATYSVGRDPRSVVVAKLNGHLDIFTANATDNTVSVLLGNGDGTFAPTAVASPTGRNPYAI